MLKKSCLAWMAASALCAVSAQAAVLSIDYAATVTGGISVKGTISWDTTATGTALTPTQYEFLPTSVSLFVNNVNYSGSLSNTRIWLSQTDSNQDSLELLANLSAIPALPAGINSLLLSLDDNEGGIFNGVGALPSAFSAFDGAEIKNLFLSGRDPTTLERVRATGSVTLSESVTPTPTVPEPGSLLLVALAGLALGATRRRQVAG